MGIFLNTIFKHVLTLSMLTFVVMPFVSNLAQGSPMGSSAGSSLSSLLPSISSGPSGGLPSGLPTSVAGIQRSIASMGHGMRGGGGSLYLGGAQPIFLN